MSHDVNEKAAMAVDRRKLVQMMGLAGTMPVAASLLGAPAAGAAAQDAAAGGEVVIGLDQEPPTLDPHASPSAVTFQITSTVAESLLYLDAERELHPWLAESWEANEDGSSYTFTLRQDVTFHDGEPFNAEAVKWNFDRIVAPDFQAGGALTALAGYTGSEVLDEFTIQVNFEAPFAPFLTHAASGNLGILSPAAAEALGDEFGTQIVGTGPFKVESYTASDNTVLVRFDEYNRQAPWSDREGPALLERITFKFIAEASTRVTTVETGETNVIQTIPPQDLPRFQGNDQFTVTSAPWMGIPRILMLNTALAPTDDVNVRRAVSLAIDRQALVDTVFAGVGEVSVGMLAKAMLDDPSLSMPYDREQAMALLDEAGWVAGDGGMRSKDGAPLTFILNVVDYGSGPPPEAQLIQAFLLDVGFDCQIKSQARAPWYEDNYNCATNGPLMFLRSGDYDGLFSMFHSSMIGANFGFACLSSPDVDALLEEGRQTADPVARREVYLRAEQELAEMAAAAPLVDEFSVWASQAAVQGLKFNGFTYPVLSDLTIQQ